MKTKIDGNCLLKHLSFWHKKTDEECIELAQNENGVDPEKALLNMLERDFCTELNNEILKELENINKNE